VGDGSGDGTIRSGEKMTLEQIFLRTVGGARHADQELSWLG